MAQNKKSIWAIIILVSTIISLVLLIVGAITLAVGIPVAREAAIQAALDSGVTQDEANLVATIAIVSIIVVFVLSSLLEIFKIIGGFKFSLQGKWGMFCIVVSILGAIFSVISLITDISNRAGISNIVIDVLTLAIDVLLVVACFKHKAEIAA